LTNTSRSGASDHEAAPGNSGCRDARTDPRDRAPGIAGVWRARAAGSDLRSAQEAAVITNDFSSLTLGDYAAQALTTDQRSDSGSLIFPLLGLFGETGSLLSEVKKKQRDRASYIGYAGAVVEELGDVLWYLTAVAARGGLALSDIAATVGRGYSDWQRVGNSTLSFASLQPEIMPRPTEPSEAFEKTLLQLAGEVGLLVIDQETGRLTDKQSALAGRLIVILRTLVQAANEAGVTLEAAAVKNLAKIFDRGPRERIYPKPLDADAGPEERLPRDLYVDVFERAVRGQTYVFQRCNGINIGDRLTDNAMTADDYRPLWLWEEAILEGYAAFRFLRQHRRGRIRIDLTNRRLGIETLP
jgi:NTP pyrophosphatase (non-canonical NTP hydrolase)